MPVKPKIKRKRGKKFVYNPDNSKLNIVNNNNNNKHNPFDEVSKKKFMKTTQYSQLRKEYNSEGHNSNFNDNRIAQYSNTLSEDEKAKLRFKALRLINHKLQKEKSQNNNILNKDNLAFTHKGKALNDDNINDSDLESVEDDYQFDIAKELLNDSEINLNNINNDNKYLSKKEQHLLVVRKAKEDRELKRKERIENKEKITKMDEDFAEISNLLLRRKKTVEDKTDNYYKNIELYQYCDKTKPTERIKSEEEIQKERLNKLDKLKNQRYIESNNDNSDYDNNSNNEESKMLTKKERISRLIEQRLKKAQSLKNNISNNNITKASSKKYSDDENESVSNFQDNDEDNDEDNDDNDEDEGEDEGEDEDEDEDELREEYEN